MLTLAVIGIVYGALVALVQKDWKKLVAYSSVSHLGFVMLGVFALTELGLQGGILQMVNHGLATGGLFLIVGIMYEQKHTREIAANTAASQRSSRSVRERCSSSSRWPPWGFRSSTDSSVSS